MIVQQMFITPAIAAEFLTRNTANRKLRKSVVKQIASDIESGEWLINHQPVAIDANGNLVDGQHRLNAIVATGIGVPMMVAHGVDPASYATIDVGLKRTTEDIYGVSKHAAGVAGTLCYLYFHHKISKARMEPFVNGFGPLADDLHAFAPTQVAKLTTVAIRAAVCLRLAEGGGLDLLNQYRAYTLISLQEVRPVIQSFVKQLLSNKKMGWSEQIARAYRAFGPDNADSSRLQIRPNNDIANEMRESIGRILGLVEPIAQAAD